MSAMQGQVQCVDSQAIYESHLTLERRGKVDRHFQEGQASVSFEKRRFRFPIWNVTQSAAQMACYVLQIKRQQHHTSQLGGVFK